MTSSRSLWRRLTRLLIVMPMTLLLLGNLPDAALAAPGDGMAKKSNRHMESWSKWLWIPVATVNGLAFSLAGYIVGYVERRSGRWSPPAVPAELS